MKNPVALQKSPPSENHSHDVATIVTTPLGRATTSIVVHSHLRWDFVWQRPQQIFSRLASARPVLFVEEPCEAEGASRIDLTEPMPNIVRAIPYLNGCRTMGVDEQCEAILPMLLDMMAQHPSLKGRFDRSIHWFYSPMTAPVFLREFGHHGIVYDCMDELANFRFAPADIAQREQFLLERADVVFTGGYQLYQAKSKFHLNTHFFGCGVDTQHFGRARVTSTVIPPDLTALPRPVFGYFGVIDERLDYDLIARLAEAFPNASVAMVGPLAKVERQMLPTAANIHWLGQRAYDDLPAIVKGFDVCLMPFALNDATRYINPTKTLEYLAAAKPVVSTAIPDVMHHFSDVVYVADSHRAFVRQARKAVGSPDALLIARGVKRAEQSSWSSIVASIDDHLSQIGQLEIGTSGGAKSSYVLQRGIPLDESPGDADPRLTRASARSHVNRVAGALDA